MEAVRILLIEDDPGDIRLTREALKDSRLDYSLNVVRNGVEAMDYLYKKAPFDDAVSPNIILLDLNLPLKDGREVLKEIKDDKNLKHIPVIVLSTSDNTDDIRASYNLYANCYVTKPTGFEEFVSAVKTIESFWFNLAQLP